MYSGVVNIETSASTPTPPVTIIPSLVPSSMLAIKPSTYAPKVDKLMDAVTILEIEESSSPLVSTKRACDKEQ